MAERIRVVSGGQTGVDRAALDAARDCGLEVGGWCPRGRRAEDGRIPDRYPLRETPSSRYDRRTAANVEDSDATLILYRSPLRGGTLLTKQLAERRGKPLRTCDLDQAGDLEETAAELLAWIRQGDFHVLNVAGPRESQAAGIGEQARRLLTRLFQRWADPGSDRSQGSVG